MGELEVMQKELEAMTRLRDSKQIELDGIKSKISAMEEDIKHFT